MSIESKEPGIKFSDLTFKKVKMYLRSKWRKRFGGVRIQEKDALLFAEIMLYRALSCPECVKDKACLKTKGGCGCFDKETEVLTDEGWKFWPDVTGEERFLSTDPKSGKVEYVKPVTLIKYPFKGELDRLKSKTFDLLTTPNHKHFIFNKRKNKRELKTLQEARTVDKFINVASGSWLGKNPKYKKIGEHKIAFKHYCQLMGWYLSEGNVRYKNGKPNGIIISQQKVKNHKEIQDLLEICFGKILKNDKYIAVGLSFKAASYFTQFGKVFDKHVPEDIRMAEASNIQEFLDAFHKGDGSQFKGKNRMTRKRFHTASKHLRDDISELIIKTGKRPSIVTRPPRIAKHFNGVYTSKTDNYDVHINQRQVSGVVDTTHTKEKYDDLVYDVFLEKYHTLFVRRNGKFTISGNCSVPEMMVAMEATCGKKPEFGGARWHPLDKDNWQQDWIDYKEKNKVVFQKFYM